MIKSILIVDTPKRSQNNCAKFVVPYEESKTINYGQKYMVLVFPLADSEYKYNRFKATIGGLSVNVKEEKVIN